MKVTVHERDFEVVRRGSDAFYVEFEDINHQRVYVEESELKAALSKIQAAKAH